MDLTTMAVLQNAYERPNARLIAYQPIALPQFSLRLNVVLQRRKPIPALQEYVLRGVDGGLLQPDEVSGFLGIDPRLAERAIVTEIAVGHLSYDSQDNSRRLGLTANGRQALAELASIEPEQAQIDVIFDRRLWSVVAATDRGLLRPRDVQVPVMRPLYSRTPRLDELSVEQIAAATAHALGRRSARLDVDAEIQLLGVRNVDRTEARFRPATLLLYGRPRSKEVDAIVVVDGHPSAEYTQSLAARGGLDSTTSGDALEARNASFKKATAGVTKEIVKSATAGEPQVDEARRALVEVMKVIGGLADDSTVDRQTSDPREELHQVRRTLAAFPARLVQPWEHAALFDDALATARARLLIASPAVSFGAVTPSLLTRLEQACRRGAQVTVIACVGEEGSPGSTEAMKKLRQVAERHVGLTIRSSVSPVRAALVSDGYAVLSEFPWLGSDTASPLRTELGLGLSDTDEVNRIYNLLRTASDHLD